MKRIICLLAALIIATSGLGVSAVEKSAGLSENKIIEIMGALEIMQGDEHGNLNLDKKVTRAEFVKMAVAASSHKNEVGATPVSPFPDVGASHWAAGYIKTAVNYGWINGYLDGSFRPSGNVKLEEAVNISLKLLGYTTSDFEGSYPSAQLAKYDNLDMELGITASRGEEMTRRNCMYLIYNTLCTRNKSGTDYAKSLGYTTDSNGNIDYDALVEMKTKGPFVVTDAENWKKEIGFDHTEAKYYKDGKTVTESEISLYDVIYYSPEFSSVWIYDDKTAGIVGGYLPDSNNPKSVTVSGKALSLVPPSDYSGELSEGAFREDSPVVVLLGKDGCAVEAYDARMLVASSEQDISDIPGNTVFYRENIRSDRRIDEDSLVYYSEDIASAFVYETTAVGVITDVLPSKDNPTSVVLGSKTYELTDAVAEDFRNANEFGENDFVTLYLGSGTVVEHVAHADIFDTSIYEENGLDYATLVSQTIKGPVIALGSSWESEIDFEPHSALFYLDGKAVEKSVIRDYDVIYHSPAFKTVWIYSDKVTGMVEKVLPGTVAPSSVTVGGVEYKIETSDAAIDFTGKGDYRVGDTVTLLLGKDGGVVDVIDPKSVAKEYFGVSTKVEKKEYTSVTGDVEEGYFVTVSAFDGGAHTVKTDNKNFDTGILVSVTVSDGQQKVMPYSVKYNNVDNLKSLIKSGRFAADAVVVDYYGTEFVTTYPSRIADISITAKNVAYYNINAEGLIDYLVLYDATGETHSYGIVFRDGGTYSFNTSSKNSSISNYTVPPIGVVQVKYSAGEARSIVSLAEHTITSVDSGYVAVGGRTFRLSDYAEYFVLEQQRYTLDKESSKTKSDVLTKSSLDYIKTLVSADSYTVKAYTDSSNIVRVIVAQKNKY